jgi:glycosyltransferase involved in cell wall biosynthesis
VIAVSERDRAKFESEYDWKNVYPIDTAVDLDYFTPGIGPERQDRLAFVGSLDWMPNEDGVIRFVHNVWPMVRNVRPGATFAIVGRNPSAAIKRLAEAPGVEVAGSVPDVRPYLNEASVIVVPLQVGGGTRLKIFAAMAMAKAVVSTTLGAEGLPVEHGRELLIADDDALLAQSIADLFMDVERRKWLGQNAYALVRQQFDSEAIARQFEEICLNVVRQAGATGSRPASFAQESTALKADIEKVGRPVDGPTALQRGGTE